MHNNGEKICGAVSLLQLSEACDDNSELKGLFPNISHNPLLL